MEIRAPYILVGIVTVLAILALAVFTVWLTNAALGSERDRYLIYFDDPISGLDIDSAVRFNGIRVGRVISTRIDHEKPTRIRVTVEVAADTPVRGGASAVVLPQGITGTSYVQIRSGQDAGPPLVAEPDQPLPVIPSETSPLQRVVGGAPDLVAQSTLLVERLAEIVDDENRLAFARALDHIEEITARVATQSKRLDEVAAEFERISTETRTAARSVDAAADSVLAWVEEDLDPFTSEARRVLGRLDTSLNGELAPRLIGLTHEIDRVVTRAASIVDEIEASPRSFLIGRESRREVELR